MIWLFYWKLCDVFSFVVLFVGCVGGGWCMFGGCDDCECDCICGGVCEDWYEIVVVCIVDEVGGGWFDQCVECDVCVQDVDDCVYVVFVEIVYYDCWQYGDLVVVEYVEYECECSECCDGVGVCLCDQCDGYVCEYCEQ